MVGALNIRHSFGVRGKIVGIFAICIAFTLGGAVAGFWQLSASLEAFDTQVRPSQSNAVAVVTTEATFKKQVQEWKDTLLRGKNPELLKKHWANFEKYESEVRERAEQLSRSIPDAEATQLVVQFLDAHRTMGEAYRHGLQQFKEHDFDSAIGDRAVAGMDRAPTELLTKAKQRLASLAAARAREVTESAHRVSWTTAIVLAAVSAAAIALFLVVIQRGISRPLTRVVGVLGDLARGNTAVVVTGSSRRDEVGALINAVQIFKERMIEGDRLRGEQERLKLQSEADKKAVLGRIADEFEVAVGTIVGAVSSASAELTAAAGTLTEQAKSSQALSTRVAASSEEVSANVQSVATATEEMTASIGEIGRRVQESSRIAGEAVGQVRTSDERMGKLAEAATRIGDVTQLITTIAEQTNLLALNATIEAARAGASGKGFAVVAQEVKQLAAQTAKATSEISAQIAEMQAATQESVGAIKQIGGTIGRVSEIATTIASAVEEQGAATEEISRNIQQAALGTTQVAGNIAEVEQGATRTGASSAQVLSAAKALSAQSSELKAEVHKFLTTVRAA